jgi:hypothetical protein
VHPFCGGERPAPRVFRTKLFARPRVTRLHGSGA